jgi:hypothetical protein
MSDSPQYTDIVHITLSLTNYKEYLFKVRGENERLVPKSGDSYIVMFF